MANNSNNNSNPRTIQDMLRDGVILESYTQKNFCKVMPCDAIHKVKWTIVDKSSQGKNHLDFYMDREDFRMLMDDIKEGKAATKFAKDMESQYPSAYKYVTGKDGSKHLNIGGGTKGVRVQIQDAAAKVQKMTIIPFKEMKTMEFLYRLVSRRYYAGLEQAYWDGAADRQRFFAEYSANEDGTYPTNTEEAPAEEPKVEKPKAEQPKAEQPKAEQPKAEQPKVEQPKAEQAPADKPALKPVTIKLKVNNPIVRHQKGTTYVFSGFDKDNRQIYVFIPSEKVESGKDAEVNKVVDAAKAANSMVYVSGQMRESDGKYYCYIA